MFWRTLFSRVFFPVVLFGSVLTSHQLIQAGWEMGPIVFGSILASTSLILLVQRWAPFDPEAAGTPTDFQIDLAHMISTGLTAEVVKAVLFGALFMGAAFLSSLAGGDLWPTTWMWPAQLALALLISDFGAYWFHRLAHQVPLLWRVHAMHHSSERLYVLASGRNHPLNVMFSYSCQVIPLVLLGVPAEIIALISVFTGVHGMLQHSNVDLHYGFWNWIFATADLHRWHHSADFEESNTNFGSNLILWDIVFQTRYLPSDRTKPVEAGLGTTKIPDTWWAHITSPFYLDRYETGDGAASGSRTHTPEGTGS